MCTAHSLTVSRSIRGRGACMAGGCACVAGVVRGTHAPSPVDRMTDACKNITLPQTSFAGGNEHNDWLDWTALSVCWLNRIIIWVIDSNVTVGIDFWSIELLLNWHQKRFLSRCEKSYEYKWRSDTINSNTINLITRIIRFLDFWTSTYFAFNCLNPMLWQDWRTPSPHLSGSFWIVTSNRFL